MWKLDTRNEGLDQILQPYKIHIFDYLTNQANYKKSADIWLYCMDQGKVSRASVINFLQFCAFDELLKTREVSGKGGYHKEYKLEGGWKTVEKHIINRFLLAMYRAFPNNLRLQTMTGLIE